MTWNFAFPRIPLQPRLVLSCRRVAALVFVIALVGTHAVHAQSTPGAPTLDVAHVTGPQVTLTWIPAAGGPPDLYVLEGGFAPGQVLASLPLAGGAHQVVLTLAPGVYHARLHAVAGGLRSPASNEVRFAVGVAAAPSTPRDVEAMAIGPDVILSWRPGFEGGAPDRTVLSVSGPVSGELLLPAAGPTVFGNVPHGTYVMSLRASNANGQSVPSTTFTVTVPGASIQALAAPVDPPGAPRLPVRYEPSTTPRLAEFVAREGLVAVVHDAPTEFAAILALKDWVAAQFPMGTPVPYPPWDAMIILDWIRSGYTGGFCGQYSQIFLQALAAFGIQARFLEIGGTSNPYNHYTTEVWSNDFDKWVLVDVAFNLHFARAGVPLGALEVRDALLQDRLDDVDVVLGTARSGHPDPFEWPKRTAELLYYVRFHLKANHLQAPAEPPFDRWFDMVEFLDGQTVPWELSTEPSEFPHERLTLDETSDRALVDRALNQVWLTPRRTGALQYAVDIEHSMLEPGRIEYRVVDRHGIAGPWRAHYSTTVTWPIAPGDARLEVRGVTRVGRIGPISSLHVSATP